MENNKKSNQNCPVKFKKMDLNRNNETQKIGLSKQYQGGGLEVSRF